MAVSEEQINRWANPPSETEDERCTNAVSQITGALRSRFGNDIVIIRQGSHRNRTNIRSDSDVDVAVVHTGYYFPDTGDLSEADKKMYEQKRPTADYPFSQFKSDVHGILQEQFGGGSVERKNKCIRVDGNSNRVNADVVPAYEHHRLSTHEIVSAKGIEFVADNGPRIHSFPDQHYDNGVKKNDETRKAYKSVVRILKNLRNELVDQNILQLDEIPSFFVECLVWNVSPDYFRGSTWRDDAISVTAKIWNDMRNARMANDYAEVSNLMWLFRGQSRTPQQAEDFMLKAWRYIKE